MNKIVSIILPFYNAEKFLNYSIDSVLKQKYSRWELLLINDGSSDKSKEIARGFSDSRIRYFEQTNKGVSSARNLGLSKATGEYICFLDADDAFTENSLEDRVSLFESNSNIEFVDGVVLKMDCHMNSIIEKWQPNFKGNPFKELTSLSGTCFFGPSWMIRRKTDKIYQFQAGLTHCEDLYFYMQLAREGGQYSFTTRPVLHYRNSPESAMKNLKGLENGYRYVEKRIKQWPEVSKSMLSTYRYKYKRAMFLAYLRAFQLLKALKSIF